MNSLTCAVSAVGNYSEAVLHAHFLGKLSDNLENMRHNSGIIVSYLSCGSDMLLGDNQKMNGCCGSYIVESIAHIVLIYFLGGDIAVDDLAEKTIFHLSSPLLYKLSNDAVKCVDSFVDLVLIADTCHCGIGTSAALTACYLSSSSYDLACISALGNSCLGASAEELRLLICCSSDKDNERLFNFLNSVSKLVVHIGTNVGEHICHYLNAVYLTAVPENFLKYAIGNALLECFVELFKTLVCLDNGGYLLSQL